MSPAPAEAERNIRNVAAVCHNEPSGKASERSALKFRLRLHPVEARAAVRLDGNERKVGVRAIQRPGISPGSLAPLELRDGPRTAGGAHLPADSTARGSRQRSIENVCAHPATPELLQLLTAADTTCRRFRISGRQRGDREIREALEH